MSFQYMALYTGDYLRDTRALSLAEHGCYLLLLMHYWDAREPLPLDEQELSAICNARSAGEVDSMRKVLSKYFVKMDDGFYNQRMQREIEKASAISKSRGKSGKLGGLARAKHLPSKRQASASNTTTTTNTTTIKETSAVADPWKAGKEYLIACGVPAKSAGAIIGKWAKERGHPATIAALQAAMDGAVAEPVAYITAYLQNRPSGKFDPVAYNARTA